MYSIGEIISTYRKKKGLLQQDLADELHLLGLPIPLIQEMPEAACRRSTAIRLRKGTRRYALQHGQQAHVPHGGEVVAEVVVTERIPDPICEGALVDLILINDSQVVIGAGQDDAGIQLPCPTVK